MTTPRKLHLPSILFGVFVLLLPGCDNPAAIPDDLPVDLSLPFFRTAQAQDGISISIDKHAQITFGGGVIITVRIACEPLPGVEDFQEAFAGVQQAKTGADSEGGIDGTVVCDGLERIHTARLSPLDKTFRR